MEIIKPQMGKIIQKGFQLAARSWQGMVAYVLIWLVVFIMSISMLFLTRPPLDTLNEIRKQQQTQTMISESMEEEEARGVLSTQKETQSTTQMQAGLTEEQKESLVGWSKRAIPALIFIFVFGMLVQAYLNGARLGYLAHGIRGETSKLSNFWESGRVFFVPFLSVTIISLLGLLMVVGVLVLPVFLLRAIPVLSGIYLFLILFTLPFFFVWLGVRLVFWRVAIIMNLQNPVEAAFSAFKATGNRFWHVFLFLICLAGISLAVNIAGALLGALPAVGLLAAILQGAATVYVDFTQQSAILEYYRVMQSPATSCEAPLS